MGDDKSDRVSGVMDEVADIVSQAVGQESRPSLEQARTMSAHLLKKFGTEQPDRASPSYVWGAHEMIMKIADRLLGVFLPDDAQEVAQRHKDLLKEVRAKPDIQEGELTRLTPGAVLPLDELYDKHLIEPVASSPKGLRLTYAGQKALRLLDATAPAPTLSVEMLNSVQPPSADSKSETVQKLDQVLRQCEEIEASTRSLFDLGRSAAELCAAIDSQFGFDFSAVQLERRDENTIETVAGTGIARDWVGLAKHRIEEDMRLRDIQADIFKEQRVEIIVGMEDPILERLDPFIGRTFDHGDLVRIFVPLVLIRDSDGQVLTDANVWEPWSDGRSGCEVYKLALGPGQYAKVIGTVEAGFKVPGDRAKKAMRQMAYERASELANFATRYCGSVYQNTLTFVLERVANMALRLAQADFATVQWGTIGEDKKVGRWQTVGSGRDAQEMLNRGELRVGAIGGLPREGGLGTDALKDGQPKFIDKGLQHRNESLASQGIRAMAVYPSARLGGLSVGQKVCLIYTHFRDERTFTDEELKWVHHLARRSGDILPMAFELAEGREQQRQLETMHRVVATFSDRSRLNNMADLLSFIAWSTLNLHGADVVTIYHCDPANDRKLIVPPARAGRLKHPRKVDLEAKSTDAPMLLLGSKPHDEVFFVTKVRAHKILDPHQNPDGFVSREKIKSTAALRLIVQEEARKVVVGVMFVNYREHREFSPDDRNRLKMLAALSAMALKNFEMSSERLVAQSAIAKLAASLFPATQKAPPRITPTSGIPTV